MYTYFAIRSTGYRLPKLLAMSVTLLQILQMFICTLIIVYSYWNLSNCPYAQRPPIYFGLTMYGMWSICRFNVYGQLLRLIRFVLFASFSITHIMHVTWRLVFRAIYPFLCEETPAWYRATSRRKCGQEWHFSRWECEQDRSKEENQIESEELE